MDNAGLMLRLGKYGLNGLRHTLEAVCDGDQDVLYATVFQFRKYRRPESRAFVFMNPHAEHIASAVTTYAESQMNRHLLDDAVLTDIDVQSVKEHHRVDRIQRTALPLPYVVIYLFRHGADEFGTHFNVVLTSDELSDFTGRQSASI